MAIISTKEGMIITGNLGFDPRIATLKTGKPVANLRLASNVVINGEQETVWHNVVMFGDLATSAADLKKGNKITVFGKEQVRTYDKDGETREVTEILADRFELPA